MNTHTHKFITRPPLSLAQATVAKLRIAYAGLGPEMYALCRPRQRTLPLLGSVLKLVDFALSRGWRSALLVDFCRRLADSPDYIPRQLRSQEMQLRFALQWLQS